MRKRVSKLTAAQLDLLGDALIDFQRKADLSRWLKEIHTEKRNGKNGEPNQAA
jgi:hypothetical protein